MITREKLIEVLSRIFSENTEEKITDELKDMNIFLDYSDKIETFQDIITNLKLSFNISELSDWWTIAYYEKNKRIIHIWDMNMSYESIDELLNELNTFESLVPNN